LTTCRGEELKEGNKIFSLNILEDISDHLANYTIICYVKPRTKPEHPFVRIFSQKKKQKFTGYLQISNFDDIFFDSDANTAYNKFITIVHTGQQDETMYQ